MALGHLAFDSSSESQVYAFVPHARKANFAWSSQSQSICIKQPVFTEQSVSHSATRSTHLFSSTEEKLEISSQVPMAEIPVEGHQATAADISISDEDVTPLETTSIVPEAVLTTTAESPVKPSAIAIASSTAEIEIIKEDNTESVEGELRHFVFPRLTIQRERGLFF